MFTNLVKKVKLHLSNIFFSPFQVTINFLKIRKDLSLDNISKFVFKHLPKKNITHLSKIFNRSNNSSISISLAFGSFPFSPNYTCQDRQLQTNPSSANSVIFSKKFFLAQTSTTPSNAISARNLQLPTASYFYPCSN